MPTQNRFWAGTAESYNAVVEGMAKAQERLADMGMQNTPDMPRIWDKMDGVATISINGSLTSGSAGYYGQFFGVLGYDDIRKAVVEAASDPEVKSILLHVNSGGGSVSGVDDLAKFIGKVNQSKPIAAYTDGMMASAAYWLASGVSNIMAGSTAIVGSLGVLSVHTERSQMLKEAGIAVTVVRAGKYKALANSVEPLTEAALAEVQGQVNDMYDIFMAQVAAGRNVTVSTADSQMGQGREFLGKGAVTAGLVDKLATYDQALAAAKKLDKNPAMMNNPQKSKGIHMVNKATLNESQLAALAAGASLEAVAAAATANVVEDDAVAQAALAATEAAALAATEAAALAATEAAALAAATGNTSAFALTPVDLLQAQLVTAQEAVITARIESSTFKAQVEANAATHTGLLAIARAAVGKMAVALGGTAEASAHLDAVAVLAQYAQVEVTFKDKFKVGGVAATAQATDKKEVSLLPYELAMIQAANGK